MLSYIGRSYGLDGNCDSDRPKMCIEALSKVCCQICKWLEVIYEWWGYSLQVPQSTSQP